MQPSISTIDILKNDTRFLIHSLLSIFYELSLKQISNLLGKSKSSIHTHINYMIEGGLVRISREENSRSDKNRYFYTLTTNADDKTKYICPTKVDDQKAKSLELIDIYISFSLTKIKFLEHWAEFLESLKQNILTDEDSTKAIDFITTLNQELLSTISFYSKDLGAKCYQNTIKQYNELEDAANAENQVDAKRNRPLYVGVDIIPIKKMFDYLEAHKKTKSKDSET